MTSRFAIVALLAATSTMWPRAVRAQAACIHAFETAQEARQRNDLLTARGLLVECVNACPSTLREQCVGWRDEIDAFLSSVRIAVRDERRQPVHVDAAYVDERPVDAATEVMLVPGDHVVRVEIGDRSLEARISTKARQRGYGVDLVLPSRTPAPVAPAPQASKVPSFVAFGVGAAFAVGAIVLTTYGHVRRAELSSSCSPRCDPDDAKPIETAWWTAGAFGVVAVAGAAVGLLLWPRSTTTAGLSPVQVAF